MKRQRHSAPAETSTPAGVSPKGMPRGFAFVVAGVMAAGALSGLLLNHTDDSSPREASALRDVSWPAESRLASRETVVQSETGVVADLDPQPATELVSPVRRMRLRALAVQPPADPFEPAPLEPAPSGGTEVGGMSLPPVRPGEFTFAEPVAKPTAPAPVRPAPAPAGPRPEEISLTGIIQGEPPLAVVRYQGQSHFLKIGDRVADSWRLEEIKERSAVLKLGDERVEVPIQGGSTQ